MSVTQIKTGDSIPNNVYFGELKNGEEQPQKIARDEVFKGKKVVIFGIPGAFTSVCSAKHLPEFVSHYEEFQKKGIDTVACVAVNGKTSEPLKIPKSTDPYVMREWAKGHNVDQKVRMLADGDKTFHSALGLLQILPFSGERGRRFSAYVDNGVIKILNVEEPGALSYKVSGPERMLKDLEELGKKQ
ncbi:7409_t:CDS:2 [Ambispora gerdemannii]|uniref:7409_t:CDS:1 n=1 Tax=Ambispora gerdemannii TaxID=144530 RepID=A0A9N9BUW5_9GLOM|nr:7409_t:CDS:2 [Ambispora gerdemannii]